MAPPGSLPFYILSGARFNRTLSGTGQEPQILSIPVENLYRITTLMILLAAVRRVLLLVSILALSASTVAAQVNVLTANYGLRRTNANLNENVLNRFNVNAAQFGLLFSLPVQGYINAQPLYMQGVAFPGKGTHNVVYVATLHNDVYAFDADSPGDSLWHVNLGPAAPNENSEVADLQEIGILGTPVIDAGSQTIYVVAYTQESGAYIYRLHALDITTGSEKFGGPTEISGSLPGTASPDVQNGIIPFAAEFHLQRPGLLLTNNTVYIGFGSHGDYNVFHGWLFGYNAADISQQVQVFLTTPFNYGASIWQGGRAPAVDEDGNIYLATGNGYVKDGISFGESFLKLSTASGPLTITDWFTPDYWAHLNDLDSDLGSCGPVLTSSDLVIGGGKEGVVWVLDPNNFGHLQTGNPAALQKFQAIGFGIYNLAFWEKPDASLLYLRANNDGVKAFQMVNSRFGTSPVSQSAFKAGLPFDGMAISANGSAANTGILWVTAEPNSNHNDAGVLHALLATDVSTELWNSELNPAQDRLGILAKFAAPTIANGKVYVATFSNQLMVYGLKVRKSILADVVNAASGLSGPIAPGEMVIADGTGLGPSNLAGPQVEASRSLSTSLAGTKILFNGVAAPLVYAQANQVAAIVPDQVTGASFATVQAEYQGITISSLQLAVAETVPGLFTIDQSGLGQGAILNQDASVNSAGNPAARGSIVVMYATGQGPTDPDWAEDELAITPSAKPVNPVTVAIGGQKAAVLYAGAAPGLAALIQINARVPSNIQPGTAVPVVVTIGNNQSQAGVTLAVK